VGSKTKRAIKGNLPGPRPERKGNGPRGGGGGKSQENAKGKTKEESVKRGFPLNWNQGGKRKKRSNKKKSRVEQRGPKRSRKKQQRRKEKDKKFTRTTEGTPKNQGSGSKNVGKVLREHDYWGAKKRHMPIVEEPKCNNFEENGAENSSGKFPGKKKGKMLKDKREKKKNETRETRKKTRWGGAIWNNWFWDPGVGGQYRGSNPEIAIKKKKPCVGECTEQKGKKGWGEGSRPKEKYQNLEN